MQTAMCYLQMTRIVLPQMLERKKGAIINISSASGVIPVPLLTVYSGTKVQADSHLISHKDEDLLLLCQFLFFFVYLYSTFKVMGSFTETALCMVVGSQFHFKC